jgi:hypothetical protein
MVSGKGGGYYGCMDARRGSCDNTVKVRRKVIEQRFIEILQQRVLQPEHFELLCKENEKAIKEEAKCRVKVLPIIEQGRRTSNEGATTQEWWTWGYANSNRAGVQGRSPWPSFESWRKPSSNR